MLRLGVITDVHTDARPDAAWHNRYDQPGTLPRLEAALETFGGIGVDALVILGDITDSGRPEAFAGAVDLLAGWTGPLVAVAGNHDQQVAGAFATALGRLESADSIALAGADLHTIGLEGEWPGRLRPRLATAPSQTDVQVVAGHYPVRSQEPATRAAGLKYAGDLADRPALEAAVRALGECTVALCGHLHVRAAEASGGLLQLAFASLIEYPYEVGVVDVDGDRVRRRCLLVEPHPPGHEADTVLASHDQCWVFEAGAWREVASPNYGE
jgi:predicted phosphodiesterase